MKDGTFPFRGRDRSIPSGFFTYRVRGAGVMFAASAMTAAAVMLHILLYWFLPLPSSSLARQIFAFATSVLCGSVLAFIIHELFYG